MSKPCQIRVSEATGKYCCEVGHLEVYDNCIGNIKFANLPETTVEYEVTPDEWIPASPAIISGSGCEMLFKPGTYRFNIDCEALDNTLAPEEGAIGLCYECCKIEDYNQLLLACMLELKDLIAAGDDTAAIMTIITQLEAICTKLLDFLTELDDISTELQALCTKLENVITALEAMCDKIEQGFDNIEAVLTELLEFIQEEIKACLDSMIEGLIAICEKQALLQETLESVICPQPPCASSTVAPLTYTNSDNTTEMDISVGGNGDVKINSGGGDQSDQEITQYITDCLAAGNDVAWSATGVSGESASGTFLAAATTNAFPNFYNQSTDATPSGAFKVSTMTATCLETAEEAGMTLKTYDQCAVTCLEDIKELLTCPPATASGVLTSW